MKKFKQARHLFLLLAAWGILLIPATATAQQVEEFSLIRENAFVLNPALAGMNGWLHGTGTFRKQFTRIDQSPYTAMLAIDGKILGKNFGIGGYLIHDVTGPTGKSGATVSAAYNLQIYRGRSAKYSSKRSDHIISFGLSLSVVQYRLRGDQLDVNDPGDPDLYTSKGYKIFPDASFGVYYRYKDMLYAGVSAPQIMGLNVNYRGADGTAQVKKVQHLNILLGGKLTLARGNFWVEPVAAFRWVKGGPPQGDVGVRLTTYKVFFLGANYRSLNYMVFEGGFKVKELFNLSYAYDFNFSKYRADMGSTHEISLSFRIDKSDRTWKGRDRLRKSM